MSNDFMPNWNNNLSGEHLQIARSPAERIRVLAGPGTGKTYALMRRIWRLLETDQVEPRRILVSTFTRTAAKDLEKALEDLGVEGAEHVHAGTLHSLSFSILSRAEVLEHTGRHPRPLLDFETRFLIADLAEENFSVEDSKAKLKAFNAAWARLQSDTPGWLESEEDQAFDRALRGWLVFHKAMLIGELVPECRRYLRDNPECPERQRFDHVLVDEYQDLNRAEQEVLDMLAGGGALAVIGDENQSIYSFKHAHPEGIVEFHESHPNTTNHSLTVCQRCPRRIVEMSNALLAAGNRNARQLHVDPNKPDGEVHIVQWDSIQSEADGIAAMIKRRIDAGGVEAGKVLVLAQRRQFGYAIRDALKELDVPAHSFFSEQELDGNPKKSGEYDPQEAFTLLTLLADPNDLVALRCWCGFGSQSLRSGAWKRVRNHAAASGLPVRTVLNQLSLGGLMLPHTGDVVARYRILRQREQAYNAFVGAELLNAVFPENTEWSEPLRALADDIEEDDYTAEDLLETLRSGIVQPEMPTETDYVRIMSLHKSKGLTADFVAVVGLIEGVVPGRQDPNKTPAEQQAKLDEDRRVFYVALTRAKKTLLLSSVTKLGVADAAKMGAAGPRYGNYIRTQTSRFLSDLGRTRPQPIRGTSLPQ